MYLIIKDKNGKTSLEKSDVNAKSEKRSKGIPKDTKKIKDIDKEEIKLPDDILPYIFDDIGIKDKKIRKALTIIATQDWDIKPVRG